MEGKIIALVLLFGLCIGGAGWVLNMTSTNELEDRISERKTVLRGVERSIEQVTFTRLSVLQSKNRAEEYKEKVDAVQAKLKTAKASIAKLTEEAVGLEARFASLVEDERKAAVGTVLPQLILNSGKVLQQAKFVQIDAGRMTIQHSEGVIHLTKKDLPADLVNRFQIGELAPGEPAIAPLKLKEIAQRNPSKLKELRTKLAVMEANLRIARGNLMLWERKAADYKGRYDMARAAGRSASIAQVTDAEANITTISKQITVTEAQRELLLREINDQMETPN